MFKRKKKEFSVEDILTPEEFLETVKLIQTVPKHLTVAVVAAKIIKPKIKKINKTTKTKNDPACVAHSIVDAIMNTLTSQLEGEINDETIIH